MIVVRVELHSAITGEVSEIGRAYIANDGTSRDSNIGHYKGMILRRPGFKTATKRGRVENYPRKRLTIWHLVARMLKDMGYVK